MAWCIGCIGCIAVRNPVPNDSKSWENGSIHGKLMWAPRKDSWIFRSLRDWLSILCDLTAIAFRHVSTGCQAIRRFSNIQDAALFQLRDNHRIVKQLVLQLKLTTNAVKKCSRVDSCIWYLHFKFVWTSVYLGASLKSCMQTLKRFTPWETAQP